MTLHIEDMRTQNNIEFQYERDFLAMVTFCSNYCDVFLKLNSFEKSTQQQPNSQLAKAKLEHINLMGLAYDPQYLAHLWDNF